MSDQPFASVRDEIRFFMDKGYQVSFGYFGALAALIAATKLQATTDVAATLGFPVGMLLAIAIVLLNVLYLSVAGGCLFGVLKRGYFILTNAGDAVDREVLVKAEWEVFVRSVRERLFANAFLDDMAWNVDNYYMVPILTFIVGVSVAALVYAWLADASTMARAVTVGLALLHLLPIATLMAVARLDGVCRKYVAAHKSE